MNAKLEASDGTKSILLLPSSWCSSSQNGFLCSSHRVGENAEVFDPKVTSSVTGVHRVTFQHWTQEARGGGWDGTLCVRHYYGGGSVVKNGPHLGGNVAKLLVTTLWQNTLFLSARPLSLLWMKAGGEQFSVTNSSPEKRKIISTIFEGVNERASRSKSHLEEEEIVCGSNRNDVLLQICRFITFKFICNIFFTDASSGSNKSKPVDAKRCGESSCWNRGNQQRSRPFSSCHQSTPKIMFKIPKIQGFLFLWHLSRFEHRLWLGHFSGSLQSHFLPWASVKHPGKGDRNKGLITF